MNDLRFGYCDAIINPPESMGLGGYEYRNWHGFGNSGVMDDLYARALSLKSEDEHLILLTVDICAMSEETANSIRESVATKIRIPVENVMLSLSHTHSGPMVLKVYSNRNSEIDRKIDSYVESTAAKIAAISSEAGTMGFKGRLYASTLTACMGYNRRYEASDENGSEEVRMLFDLWRNPDHKTTGVVDPNIPILMIERVDEPSYDPFLYPTGMDRIILFSVPTHPVVMGEENRYVSADYPGAARRCIEETLGTGTKAMFVLGACGNINSLLACQCNPAAVDIVGRAIGYGVCAALSLRREVEFDGLKSISEDIELGDHAMSNGVSTQVFRVGKAAIAAVSNECFTEMGIEIRSRSPFEQTLVATNSNGGYGYIPTEEAFKKGKGYEVKSAREMGFEADLLERVADTVIRGLHKLS